MEFPRERCMSLQSATVLLYIFIVLAWLSGVFCIAAGIWMIVDPYDLFYFNVMRLTMPPIVLTALISALVVAGALTGVAGICGCCGIRTDSKGLLRTFIVSVVFIMILEFLIGAVAVVLKRDVQTSIKSDLKIYLREEYTWENSLGGFWNTLQVRRRCCGVDGPSDYRQSKWWHEQNNEADEDEDKVFVPLSCCKLSENATVDDEDPETKDSKRCQEDAGDGNLPSEYLHTMGCVSKYPRTLQFRFNALIGLGFIFGSFQITGLVIASCIVRVLDDVKII